jgi:phosphoribosyl-AMP cyclohydrolase
MSEHSLRLCEAAAAQIAERLRYDERGLLPAIAQRHDTGEVLMLAWMNAAAVRASLAEGRAVYWSRSREALWRKGESSGHTQRLVALRYDCDADTILLLVDQAGPACHTDRPNCFFNEVRADGSVAVISEPQR